VIEINPFKWAIKISWRRKQAQHPKLYILSVNAGLWIMSKILKPAVSLLIADTHIKQANWL
jgi:hypothetical protein